jgi:hypothetical protein
MPLITKKSSLSVNFKALKVVSKNLGGLLKAKQQDVILPPLAPPLSPENPESGYEGPDFIIDMNIKPGT